jgi:DNA-binding NtrC family response regulator
MKSKVRCLILSDRNDPFTTLESVLAALPVKSSRAKNCSELEKYLAGPSPVHLIWTDAVLPDGDWSDVVRLAQGATEKVNVIVQTQQADISLYLEAMNLGAFDFVTESFTVPELVHVLRTAIDNACLQRSNSSTSPSSSEPAVNFGC